MALNPYQQSLYLNLLALTESPDDTKSFYFTDHVQGNTTYRIFNYRMVSYTRFLKPGGLECRGVMFELDQSLEAIRLASHPMHKFFNLHENPLTMDLDISTVTRVMTKSDGSLISTYIHDGLLRLKSKGSLASTQAIAAMNWLEYRENSTLKSDLMFYANNGFTVNMEWVAPDNRIVLGYIEPQLIVLNIRNNINGAYVPPSEYVIHNSYLTGDIDFHDDPTNFIDTVPDMTDIEGFVCEMESGMWFKIKTSWYLALHRTKDSVNSPRKLYEAVLEETSDDLRALFYDDELAMKLINDMEEFVEHHYNNLVDQVETFFEANKTLCRKDYAIKGQKDIDKKSFGLAMSLYLGQTADYVHHMKKNWKYYGIQEQLEDQE